MKVLIICTEKLPVPPVKGGAIQTYIAGAVPFLKNKHDITILGRNDPTLPEKETIDGIDYVRVPGGLLEVYRDGVVNYVRQHNFDLIHIFNRPRLISPVREVAPNARIVLSMHNDMFKPEKIDHEEGEKAIEQVDKIITISDYIGKTIKEMFPNAESKLKTIYSGVDLDRFVPAYTQEGKKLRDEIRKGHNLESKKVILFTGRLSPNKGADILVKAMPLVAKKFPDVALVLVGSKWFSVNDVTDYIAYVRALAERLPIPVVTTGFIHPTEIHKWFAAADVFVCPSQWQEPLARVHYEAMAAGLPIITTNRGGNTEVIDIGKNGLVVENPEEPGEFAEHLITLLSDSSLRKEMGQFGRKKAEANFNWNRVVSDIKSVWDEIEDKIKNNIAIGTVAESTEEIDISKIMTDTPVEEIELAETSEEILVAEGDVIEQQVVSTDGIEEKPEKNVKTALSEIFNVMKENINLNEEIVGKQLTAQVREIVEMLEEKMLNNLSLQNHDFKTVANDLLAKLQMEGTEYTELLGESVLEAGKELGIKLGKNEMKVIPKKNMFYSENNPPAAPWLALKNRKMKNKKAI
ncbi:glycosyltransferase family 4 protein [Anaerobacillus sp. MEB173]|uniref:glycosyltransferase family 4 protein n=1 Tax=Anaerobacillus sp. MEB173 TaxID=3383345 RepID=UPI003F8EC092